MTTPTTAPSPTRATQIIKFADDTTVVGLISRSGGDESAYRDEVEQLAVWCRYNNLLLNTKTRELIIDLRKNKADMLPPTINGDCVERVPNFHFL